MILIKLEMYFQKWLLKTKLKLLKILKIALIVFFLVAKYF